MIDETAAAGPSGDDGTRRDAPISELVRSLLADVSLLVRREAELATIELKAKASKAALAAALLGAAILLTMLAAGTLVAMAVLALAILLPAWAAALVVAVVLLAAAAALFVLGRNRLRDAGPLAPTQTIETVREDIGWVRLKTEELHPSE